MKTYECEIVDPMFAHGADSKIFDLRATEIKGGMRFWFRTALSSKLKNNIKVLKFIESYIFGDTSEKSKVIVSVDCTLSQKTNTIQGTSFHVPELKYPIDPIKYIAFGMYDSPKAEQWHAYVDQGIFKINLSFFSVNKDNSINKQEIQEIESIVDSVMFLYSTFGGIGAKSDKGFGSFQIKSIQFDPKNLVKMADDAVENIYEKSKIIFERIKPKDLNFDPVEFDDKIQTYPFFDPKRPETFGSFLLSSSNYKEALSLIGHKYYIFRRKLEPDGNFNTSYKKENYKAKRALLGLPILYQQPKPTITLVNSTDEKDPIGRKGSILHMSLKKYNSKYHLVYVFLPAMIGKSNKLIADGKKVTPSSDFDGIYAQFKEILGGVN